MDWEAFGGLVDSTAGLDGVRTELRSFRLRLLAKRGPAYLYQGVAMKGVLRSRYSSTVELRSWTWLVKELRSPTDLGEEPMVAHIS